MGWLPKDYRYKFEWLISSAILLITSFDTTCSSGKGDLIGDALAFFNEIAVEEDVLIGFLSPL